MGIPNGFILFLLGVPGVGKTTLSYQLLKQYDGFRIIEETDLLRDSLRGYNDMLVQKYGKEIESILKETIIFDHKKLLSLSEAKSQCQIMYNSISNIVARQKRKGIPTIINGVHIVPEVLSNLLHHPSIVFINLYVNDETTLRDRVLSRDSLSYMLQHISLQ